MAHTVTSGSSCSIDQVKTSIFHQEKLLSKRLDQGIAKVPLYALSKVKTGSNVRNNENSNTVFTRNATRGIVPFRESDTTVKPLAEGEVTAKGNCTEGNIAMGSLVNPVDPNACEGADIVDFAHGHYFRGYTDFELKMRTPTRCIEQLANYDPKDVYRIQTDEIKEFKQTAIDSLDYQLTKYIIEKGEANGSVQDTISEPLPILTTNGWHKPPTRHVSIPYLERYCDEIDRRMVSNNDCAIHEVGKKKHSFELTREAWALAKMYDKLKRSSDGGVVSGVGSNIRVTADLSMINDKTFGAGSLMGRKYETWGDRMVIIFNDYPIRGYLQPNGFTADAKPKYKFMRIKHIKNTRVEELGSDIGIINGGVVSEVNQDYYHDFIYDSECVGGTARVLELIPCIREGSFTRHARYAGVAPAGVNPAGVNAEVNLLKDGDLSSADCPNLFKNKYLYSLRMLMRIRDVTPEYAGYILHLRQFMEDYDIPVYDSKRRHQEDVSRIDIVPVEDPPHHSCADENCDPNPLVCEEGTNRSVLAPCGDIAVNLFEPNRIVKLSVCRDKACSTEEATVDFAVTPVENAEGNSSVLDTHYQVVDEEGTAIATTGDLVWGEGEYGCKYIYIKLLSALADIPVDEEAPNPCCNVLTPTPQLTQISVVIGGVTATGTTVDCDEATINVSNFLG